MHTYSTGSASKFASESAGASKTVLPRSVAPPPAVPGRAAGATGEKTRAVLQFIAMDPKSAQEVADHLNILLEKAHSLLKHLRESGWAERTERGRYQATPAGRSALYPVARRQEPLVKPNRVHPPTRGWRWTPARKAWLVRYYPLLGHRRCSRLLGREPAVVHAMATRLGLRHGAEIEGYILLTELAEVLGKPYGALWSRARRAGTLTFPQQVGTGRNRKALVPDWWVDQIVEEMRAPQPGEVALAELRTELGMSKTHAQRLAGKDAFLRTALTRNPSNQATLHVTSETAERIRLAWQERPNRPQLGRPVVYAALHRAGAGGSTEAELMTATGMKDAALRRHLHSLMREHVAYRTGLSGRKPTYRYYLCLFEGPQAVTS